MSDINNDGTPQYDHTLHNDEFDDFLKIIYRNIQDNDKRREMINLFIEDNKNGK